MRYRRLGTSGLRISEVFLGAMTFGEQGGVGASPEECQRMLDAYAAAGGNVIDTAINYRGGRSEDIVGQVLGSARDRFVVSAKYSVTRDASDANAAGSHRKNLVLSHETSLRRLRTDYIDLYWVHIWDAHTPIEETMRALDDVVRAGKVLYVGISDTPAWVVARGNTLAKCRGWTPFVALQVPYSLLKRDIERDLLPMAEALGMTVAAWSPLAGGVLSGKYARSDETTEPMRLKRESLSELDRSVADAVVQVARELGATASQVAIAWTMAKSRALHPILGARRLEQLVDNLGAVELFLPPELISRLERASGFQVGFPNDFIASTAGWVLGAANLDTQAGARK
jgi:aryl-alcohol dehydrogenase-like predicted oxidoreductase